MPEMDGFEVLRKVKDQSSLADIPVMIVTAKDLSAAEIEMLRKEAQALIRKEGNWKADLLAIIQRITDILTQPGREGIS